MHEVRKNMLKNGCFLFGTSDFAIFCYGTRNKGNLFLNPLAHIKNGKLWIPDGNLFSDMFHYQPGREYTAVVRMRKVGADTPATATMFFCPENYKKIPMKRVKLTEEFQNYTLQGKLSPSLHNLFWFRIDGPAGKGFFEIERVQLVEGKTNTFLPLPDLEMGSTGPRIFDFNSENAICQFRFVQNGVPKSRTVQLIIRDLWGKEIEKKDIRIRAEKDQIIRYPVNTKHAGVFSVELKCGKFTGEARYYVLYRNDRTPMADNMVCWHQDPLLICEMTPFRKYMPAGRNFNRFFAPPRFTEKAVMNRYAELHDQNLACLTWKHLEKKYGFGSPAAKNILTPEVKKRFAEEVETFARHAAEGNVTGVELFNEPYLWRGTMPPEKVVKLYRIAYPILRKYAPQVKICGPCASNKALPYNERFLRAGGGKYIDILTFHSYNGDPDQGQVIELNQALREMVDHYHPEMPILNSETYYGIRGGKLAGSQEESRRTYFKDTKLEHAAAYAAFYASSLVSDIPFATYNPYTLLYGIPGSDEVHVFGAMAAINAFQHLLGNAGKTRSVYPIDEQLRCLLFPDAHGGAMATIRNSNPELNDRIDMILPETIQALDLFGNPVKATKIHVGSDLHYMRFAAGCDPQKELAKIVFSGLGFPVNVTPTLNSKESLSLKLRNRSAKALNGNIRWTKLPENWIPAAVNISFSLLPQQELLLPIPMKEFTLNNRTTPKFELEITIDGQPEKIVRELDAFPVRWSQDWKFQEADYRKYGTESLVTSGKFPGGRNLGKGDCSARIGALWNPSGLMLSICVSDDADVRLPVGTDFRKSYMYDNFQIYFDMLNDATLHSSRSFRNRSDDLDYFIGIDAGGEPYSWLNFAEGERYIGEANSTTGLDPAIKISREKLFSGEWEYRIFFPAEALYRIKFEPGTVFGAGILLNDNDGKGRKQGISTLRGGNEPMNRQYLFPDWVLLPKK